MLYAPGLTEAMKMGLVRQITETTPDIPTFDCIH